MITKDRPGRFRDFFRDHSGHPAWLLFRATRIGEGSGRHVPQGGTVIRRSLDKRTGNVRLTFVLPLDTHDGAVSVVGDFNDWTPGRTTLAKRSNGTRSASVSLPPSTTARFRYLGEGGRWFDDTDADRLDDQGGVVLA
jgi:hypothetical protein